MRSIAIVAVVLSLTAPADAQLAPLNAAGVSFAHVHLNVADVDVHTALWVDHFDGTVVQKGPLTTVKVPGALIVFTERAPTGGSQGSVMDHFGFKVPDLEASLDRWRSSGYEVQAEFAGVEGSANAYLMAPDGVRFELQEDPALKAPAEMYHVHFFTSDYRDLMAWYADVFSATVTPRGTLETTADVPGANLSFSNARDERAATQGRAIDHIGFEVADIDAFAEMLAARGIELEFAPRRIDSIELTIAFFTDPSGVRIELTEGMAAY
jgi:catechol 2,3-dioxygenase-like lactoylglutathione lyase family enzyme